MSRKVYYVAHPVSGDVDGNIKRAFAWMRYLRREDPSSAYQAPWIAGILSGEDDSDPDVRERALLDCEATAAKCDGIVLVGGRVSVGMAREKAAVIAAGGGRTAARRAAMRTIIACILVAAFAWWLSIPVKGGAK